MQGLENRNPAGIQQSGKTILLVDDEGSILEFGKAILDHFGFSTITAPNGEEALEVFNREKSQIDLVILDVNMPGMGGFQCLRELLRVDPGVKVVVASGYSSSAEVQQMLHLGAAGFIAKPFRFEDFVKQLRDILEGM